MMPWQEFKYKSILKRGPWSLEEENGGPCYIYFYDIRVNRYYHPVLELLHRLGIFNIVVNSRYEYQIVIKVKQ